jgi:nucleoside 2-deoxyribosyltransferase
MTPRVYLAGPISGQSFASATEWRATAIQNLRKYGIKAYSPMRSKEFLRGSGELPTFASMPDAGPLATSKGIMSRDHNDCIRADALLINFLGVDRVSLGTAMELAWAYDRHIPVVVVAESDNPNIVHPMAHEAIKFRVDTLAEGLALIHTIVFPEGI